MRVAAICLFLLAACRPLQMALPASLGEAPVAWPVLGLSRSFFSDEFAFGPYAATGVVVGGYSEASHSTKEQLGTVATARRTGGYSCTLGATGREWPLECAYDKESAKYAQGGWSIGTETWTAECSFVLPGNEMWRLDFAPGRQDVGVRGRLAGPGTKVSVTSVHEPRGGGWSTYSPIGFHLAVGERTLAAIEIVNAGAVFPALDLTDHEQDIVASAAAGLLLFPNFP